MTGLGALAAAVLAALATACAVPFPPRPAVRDPVGRAGARRPAASGTGCSGRWRRASAAVTFVGGTGWAGCSVRPDSRSCGR